MISEELEIIFYDFILKYILELDAPKSHSLHCLVVGPC